MAMKDENRRDAPGPTPGQLGADEQRVMEFIREHPEGWPDDPSVWFHGAARLGDEWIVCDPDVMAGHRERLDDDYSLPRRDDDGGSSLS